MTILREMADFVDVKEDREAIVDEYIAWISPPALAEIDRIIRNSGLITALPNVLTAVRHRTIKHDNSRGFIDGFAEMRVVEL